MRVVKVKFLVPAYFNSYIFSSILNIEALDNLTECSLIYYVAYEKSVPNLLSDPCPVVALGINNLLKRVASVATYREYLFELHQFTLLEHGQLVLEPI